MFCRKRVLSVLGVFALLLSSVPPLPVFVPLAEAAVPKCNGLDATIIGNNAANTLTGTAGDDVIYGDGGNDTITGNGGNDTICGGSGNDTITTGSGNDWIDGGTGNDTITTGSGDDYIEGGEGNDNINAGDGTNTVNAGNNTDSITAGSGNDTIRGQSGNDTIDGGEGANILEGDSGNDEITGGNGGNIVRGGSGKDEITTGSGNDEISGDDGSDTIVAGDGNNKVFGQGGDDDITTGGGNDFVNGGGGEDLIRGGAGNDVLYGADDDDSLDGGEGSDYCNGNDDAGNWEEGNNTLINCEADGDEGIIIVVKDAIPDNEQDFGFSIGESEEDAFTLDDDSNNENDLSNTKVLALAGDDNYYVTEEGEEGWNLASISCTNEQGDAESDVDLEDRKVEIKLDEADIIICTFTNIKAARLTVTKTTTNGTGTFHFIGIGGEDGFDLTTLEPNLTVSSFFDVFVDIVDGTSYTIMETVPEGWEANAESCTRLLHPGDEETCNFENSATSPLTLLAGSDIFETPTGTTEFPLPPLPADFFGPGCSPFGGAVQLGGVPTDPTKLGNTDTVVRRLSDASLPAPGSSDTVPIEIVALSLQSVAPIQVECEGEEPSTSFWDVTVTLPESSQPQGQMTIRRTSPAGGTFDSELPVRPLFTFRSTTDGTTHTYDTREDHGTFLTLEAEGIPWLSEPCPSDMLRIPGTTTNFCPSAESDGRVPTTATDNVAHHRYLPTGVAEEESSSSSSSSSSSEESSSSSSSSEESSPSLSSSSSSEASSSSTGTLPGDNDDQSGGAGSGHGSRTSFAKARFLASFHGVGNLPPGAFGAGPEVPLGPEELTFICSMQRSLPPIPAPGLVELIGAYMAELMGRDPAFIVEQLQDPFLCEGINTSLRLVPQTVAKATISFPVGVDGIPLSRNPSWNACIRGQVTLDVIRNNPDRDEDGKPRDCASYSTDNVWRHPDLGIHFVFHRSPLKIELPQGYAVWKLSRGGI